MMVEYDYLILDNVWSLVVNKGAYNKGLRGNDFILWWSLT